MSTNHSEWMMSQPMSKATQSRYQHSCCSENTYSAISALYNGVESSQLGLTLDSVLPKCHLGVLAQASVTKHRRLGSLYCHCPSPPWPLPYSQALHLSYGLRARQANSLKVLLPHAMILPPHQLRLGQPCPADFLKVAQQGGHGNHQGTH